PSGKSVELKPSGSHIMLIGLNKSLKAGDKIELDLKFEKFGIIKARAQVKGMQSH
ncbi:MAG TPA: copper chaperone PCu(A)C, partial [Thermodesulfobacteriota bacterium]|nr:copper chaperone PCu(A)C [Thermodesulfobacteriota bacterium]